MKKSEVRSQGKGGKGETEKRRKLLPDSPIPRFPGSFFIFTAAYSLLFTVLTGCSSGPQDKQPTARIGEPAPQFTLNLIGGGSVTLNDFRDKPLVVTFMASWCPCSNESAPVFKEAYNRYNPKGVQFLMIGIQDSETKFTKFVDKKQFPFPTGFDKGDKIARLYGVNAPPTTFFITREGKIGRAFYGKLVEIEKLSGWIGEIREKGSES